MSAVLDRPSAWQRVKPVLIGYDGPLVFAVLLLAGAGLLTMYSAGFDHGTRFVDHGRNMLLAAAIMLTVSQVRPQQIAAMAARSSPR